MTPLTALSDDPHSVTASAADVVGNGSSQSSPTGFTVDTASPAAPVIAEPTNNQIVGLASPTIRGTAEAGTTATFGLSSNKTPVTFDCQLDTNPIVACSNPAVFAGLLDGTHVLKVSSIFGAFTDATPATYNWSVDTLAPGLPILTSPLNGSSINSSSVTVRGTAEAGATVSVILDSGIAGTAIADSLGVWSLVLPVTLSEGNHQVSATATDPAGNLGGGSLVQTFTIDTVVPPAPTVVVPVTGAGLATSTPAMSGTAEAGSTVTVVIDGVSVGSVVANSSGIWAFSVTTPLSDGAHTLSATARDVAGNVSASSTPVQVTVDTLAPALPVVTQPLPNASLADQTPTLRGTAEAGSTVAVLIDGAMVGTTTADDVERGPPHGLGDSDRCGRQFERRLIGGVVQRRHRGAERAHAGGARGVSSALQCDALPLGHGRSGQLGAGDHRWELGRERDGRFSGCLVTDPRRGGGCGCGSTDGASGLLAFMALGFWALRRRRLSN